MKKEYSKTQVVLKIENFFQKDSFNPIEVKKIRRIANKYRVSLKQYKKLFCKKCFSKLTGKIRVSKTHKTIMCEKCNFRNKYSIS